MYDFASTTVGQEKQAAAKTNKSACKTIKRIDKWSGNKNVSSSVRQIGTENTSRHGQEAQLAKTCWESKK